MGIKLSELDQALASIEEEFPTVNLGGCACVASMLATTLRYEYPIMRIVSSSPWKNGADIDEIRANNSKPMKKGDWEFNGIGFYHLWVEVWRKGRWYVLDATGVSTRTEMYNCWGKPFAGSFSIDEVTSMAAESKEWNSCFDREGLPFIAELIDTRIGNYVAQ